MSAHVAAKQDSSSSKSNAVGLHLLYAWIIICVSARPDLFVLLGNEKRF